MSDVHITDDLGQVPVKSPVGLQIRRHPDFFKSGKISLIKAVCKGVLASRLTEWHHYKS